MRQDNLVFLENRLRKRYKHLKKWARKNKIFAYRLYNKDIPEFPLAVDLYENKEDAKTYVILTFYKQPADKTEDLEAMWIKDRVSICAKILDIPEENIFVKMRERKKALSQYEKIAEKEKTILVEEHDNLFKINLSNYIDTGLFLDHRNLRLIVKNEAKDKSVLNLFCYTASFSVHAASAGASLVDSVDLSNTYLEWAKENFLLNKLEGENFSFIKSDVIQFLKSCKKKYDLIILDPPTFSNSKSTTTILDINRDYEELIKRTYALLNPDGCLYFSSNSKSLKVELENFSFAKEMQEITKQTISEDFLGKRPHRSWKIVKTP